MINRQVQFLDEIHFGGGNEDGHICERSGFSTGTTAENESAQAEGAGSDEGVADVFRIARCADADEHVTRFSEAENELGVAVRVVTIVGKGGAERRETSEWNGW